MKVLKRRVSLRCTQYMFRLELPVSRSGAISMKDRDTKGGKGWKRVGESDKGEGLRREALGCERGGTGQSADTSGVPDYVAASLITRQPPTILDPTIPYQTRPNSTRLDSMVTSDRKVTGMGRGWHEFYGTSQFQRNPRVNRKSENLKNLREKKSFPLSLPNSIFLVIIIICRNST